MKMPPRILNPLVSESETAELRVKLSFATNAFGKLAQKMENILNV